MQVECSNGLEYDLASFSFYKIGLAKVFLLTKLFCIAAFHLKNFLKKNRPHVVAFTQSALPLSTESN